MGDIYIIHYDVTNYYFKTDEQNDFLHKGISKRAPAKPDYTDGAFHG